MQKKGREKILGHNAPSLFKQQQNEEQNLLSRNAFQRRERAVLFGQVRGCIALKEREIAKCYFTKDDDKCHFDRFDLGSRDDAARAGPPTVLILVQHGRSYSSSASCAESVSVNK